MERDSMAHERKDRSAGECLIGEGAVLEGTLKAGGFVRIEGEASGRIETDGPVVLAPGSVVKADIVAASIEVAGIFGGSAAVAGEASILKGARVESDITAASFRLEFGAVFSGRLTKAGKAEPEAGDGAS